MKGKNTFTKSEIYDLRNLIKLRVKADRNQQKSIRNKMRNIGFYGKDDFDIIDLQPSDFENLITSGQIKIIGEDLSNDFNSEVKPIQSKNNNSDLSKTPGKEVDINKFIEFKPLSDNEDDIPNKAGNYIVCLNNNSKLPDIGIRCETSKINNLEVIYTGIASKSLRTRDYKQHFNGNNAGRSTLRKSIGSMFKYKQVPRDKDPNTGKTKFSDDDEEKLSKWMKENLTLFFFKNDNSASNENTLIDKFNPPLNLDKNKNLVNQTFRKELSRLRNIK
ncbi:MAG: hypothetical protein A3K31_17010 [Ignavibacteria bacterium RIFOXYA12_FULL_35_25]|nr:MAG: hypothetical protein A2058_13740 [Ignavibacteria bacterium GWA2_36_19]OGU62832.1 MAG: hypothetical protein A2X60_04635 [Ignavibacteria bacterium GWF2_35_20]OGU86835.1 MAG: hypothetical protein A3K31_17010 [Ignavibacteria bacterium RIFOXYA12_FULL_35_25]OGV29953.1 MAG: hypothetical protein A2523_00990 [Ignavibacteria bacterium RIFOXYD12_FULL_36_8]